ncbi:uncharacterized protein LOC132270933 [Cornus florida]|uniref:uncharacterized protein LOC132270933 n=1 Tax=Cornus florida TaxID=4283 RepID=UPI0028969F01|nr:uncharacterized protein LOC132270933 [Cornus florida]XP_059628142.1 uncharacterized protein LOC132270933 [Cornus florida]
MVAEKRFALKVNIQCCTRCPEIVKKVLDKADGVRSIDIDTNEGTVTVTGTGTVEPKSTIKALKKKGKIAEVLWEELHSSSKSSSDDQLKIVPAKPLHHNPHTAPELQQLSKNNQGCSGCKEPGLGPRRRCDSCDYELHKECWKPQHEISNEFFKGCTFKFFDRLSRRTCDACGKDICGFGYHSEAKGKSLDLHPCCSKLRSKIFIDGNEFELRDKVLLKCKWCNNKHLHGDKTSISGWSYISAPKKCHYHVHCVTEMVEQAWKQGFIDNIDSVALEKTDPQLLHNSNRNDGKRDGDQISGQTSKIFLKTIVGVLLGDPTATLLSLLVNLLIS